MKIVLASSNKNKVREIKQIFSPFNIEIIGMDEVAPNIGDIEENGNTYYENALIKAKAISKYTSLPVMSDDSGLEVSALDNKPGIYSARYAEKLGGYISAMKEIIRICKEKGVFDAKFVCCIVLYNYKDEPLRFDGIVPGKITAEVHEGNGFGYDPFFISNELEKTFAEYPSEIKNKYSHRAKALEKMVNDLKENK